MNTPTSEVLHLAADLIEERGWIAGNDGWLADGPLCIEGAIDAAQGGIRDDNIYEFWTCPAYVAVSDYLGRNTLLADRYSEPTEPIWQWNDEQAPEVGYVRTQSEVVEVLRAAAAVEAAREDSLDRTRLMSLVAEAEANAS